MFPGRANPEPTAAFAAVCAHAAAGHFRPTFDGLTLSSLGMGTYLGGSDDRTDALVAAAAASALQSGLNVLDSAINYRCQRGERSLGRMFEKLIPTGVVRREAVFVSTKAGYVPFDGVRPADAAGYIRDTYIRTGIAGADEFVGGSQCIAPNYLRDQIRRSLANLRLQTIDLFYLHNPEYMIPALGRPEWLRRMGEAFTALEQEAAAGRIAAYGTATWDGYRVGPEAREHLELAEVLGVAQRVGGTRHRFRAIQLPVSLSAPEAVEALTQTVNGIRMSALDAAAALGVAAFASGPIGQGEALAAVPTEFAARLGRLGLTTPAQQALQWTRSRPGLTCALIGMKETAHVRENLQLVGVSPNEGLGGRG
jgi:aryl-alcohol dehydrogenase-like predicted oxidoreductase